MFQKPESLDQVELHEVMVQGRPLRFKVRPGSDDANIIHEVSYGHYYQGACSLLKEGSIVIDVGAHIGSFALSAAARGAYVLALEPLPVNYDLLVENVRLNGLQSRIKTFNLAVWSDKGPQTIRIADDSTGGSGFFYHKDTVPTISVDCIRLDDLMQTEGITTCDLLKLDCEGSEFEILATMNQETWDQIRAVVGEYHLFPGRSVAQLQQVLESQGFLVGTQEMVGFPALGDMLAIRSAMTPMSLPFIEVTLAESPLTRLPVIGRLWRLVRWQAHNLVVFYLNQMIKAYNQQQSFTNIYLRLLTQNVVRHEEQIDLERIPARKFAD